MPFTIDGAPQKESERLGSAVMRFAAACRTEEVPHEAIMPRFEAFLAAYSAERASGWHDGP